MSDPERRSFYVPKDRDVPLPGTLSMVHRLVLDEMRASDVVRAEENDRGKRYDADAERRRLAWQDAALTVIESQKHHELSVEDVDGVELPVSGQAPVIGRFHRDAEHMPLDEAHERLYTYVVGRKMTTETMSYAADLRRKLESEASTPTVVTVSGGPRASIEPGKGNQAPRRSRFSFPRLRRRPSR